MGVWQVGKSILFKHVLDTMSSQYNQAQILSLDCNAPEERLLFCKPNLGQITHLINRKRIV